MFYGGDPGVMARGGVALPGALEDVSTAPSPPQSGSETTDGVVPETPVSSPVLVDPATCDPAADCGIVPVDAPEPVTVHLTDAALDVTMVWDASGTIWLLPAYTFGDADGGRYTVIAVDDSFLDLPEVLPVPAPLPVDSIPVDTAPLVDLNFVDESIAGDALIGLSLDEATKVADEQGWTVRVSTLDGEGQILTMDLQTNRVNLSVAAGVVVGVDNVG